MARALGWLVLAGVYAAVALALDLDAEDVQAARLLDELAGDVRSVVLAGVAAGAFAAAAALARRWVPDPWATRAVLFAALSPAGFALGASSAAPPALLLALGALCTAAVRDHPTRVRALGGAACLALAPWFGLGFAVPAALLGLALVYWTYRRGRRLYALLALEFGGASVVTLASVEASAAVDAAPGLEGVLVSAAGLPALVLCAVTAALLVRSRRDHLARAIPAWRDAEVGMGVTGVALLALLATALVEPVGPEAAAPLAGALAAWGLRGMRNVRPLAPRRS